MQTNAYKTEHKNVFNLKKNEFKNLFSQSPDHAEIYNGHKTIFEFSGRYPF